MVNSEALFARVAELDKRQREQTEQLAAAADIIAHLEARVACLEKQTISRRSAHGGPGVDGSGSRENLPGRRQSRRGDGSSGRREALPFRKRPSRSSSSSVRPENGASPPTDPHDGLDSEGDQGAGRARRRGHSLDRSVPAELPLGATQKDVSVKADDPDFGLVNIQPGSGSRRRGGEANRGGSGRERTDCEEANVETFAKAISLRDGTHGGDPCPADAVVLLQRSSARGHVDSMMALADLYFSGKVAKAGSLRQHRRAALLWWEKVLANNPKHVDALCKKGEALFQVSGSTSTELLQTAYDLFDKAASLGSKLGKFLKGRWLVMMAPSHGDVQRANQGRKLVEQAAHVHGLSRAYVFLGHCYEFPQDYSPAVFDAPVDKASREDLILKMYLKAAELGDPDGLNDIGSCYATGYGSVEKSFDHAVEYYERAIAAGSLDAYDNLGTHYETGMNGAAPDLVDFHKALHFYRQGAARRCPKCVLNLGIAYEEGMTTQSGFAVLHRDPSKAEKYFMHAIGLGNDRNDAQTVERARKDLAALLLTRLKLASSGSSAAKLARERLYLIMEDSVFQLTLRDVEVAIASAVTDRPKPLELMLGEHNAQAIVSRCRDLLSRTRSPGQEYAPSDESGDSENDGRGEQGCKKGRDQSREVVDVETLWADVKAMFGSALSKLPSETLGPEPTSGPEHEGRRDAQNGKERRKDGKRQRRH